MNWTGAEWHQKSFFLPMSNSRLTCELILMKAGRERLVIKTALRLYIFVAHTIHAMVELTLITGD